MALQVDHSTDQVAGGKWHAMADFFILHVEEFRIGFVKEIDDKPLAKEKYQQWACRWVERLKGKLRGEAHSKPKYYQFLAQMSGDLELGSLSEAQEKFLYHK